MLTPDQDERYSHLSNNHLLASMSEAVNLAPVSAHLLSLPAAPPNSHGHADEAVAAGLTVPYEQRRSEDPDREHHPPHRDFEPPPFKPWHRPSGTSAPAVGLESLGVVASGTGDGAAYCGIGAALRVDEK